MGPVIQQTPKRFILVILVRRLFHSLPRLGRGLQIPSGLWLRELIRTGLRACEVVGPQAQVVTREPAATLVLLVVGPHPVPPSKAHLAMATGVFVFTPPTALVIKVVYL